MRIETVTFALGALLFILPGTALAQVKPAAPDLAKCGKYRLEEGDPELQRTKPLPVPAALRPAMAANRDFVAVTTLSGSTFCMISREWESISPPTLSADKRFLGFTWYGYEAGGYILVDRVGKGAQIDTGARPVPSPSGNRLASIEWSESGFGSLNGILVLGVEPTRLRELARLSDGLKMHDDWRIDRWVGDACFEVSAERWTEDRSAAKPQRERHAVRAGPKGWTFGAAGSACPKA